MKRISLIIYASFVMMAIICGACSSSTAGSLDVFSRALYNPKYASGFDLRLSPDSAALLLEIKRPWQGATTNDHHLIIRRDSSFKVPENFSGAVLDGFAQKLICVSSSNIAMLDAIGKTQTIVGVSGINYISNQQILSRSKEGEVVDIGYGANLNFEAILAKKPNLVLLYGASGEELNVTRKFKELGIPYIYIGDYAEQDPLGKTEWMIALSAIVGEISLAKEKFTQIERRYVEARQLVENIGTEDKPKIMLNTPYRDVWYMPPVGGYMVRMIRDAGGEPSYTKNTSSAAQPISLETAFSLVLDADFWLNVGATINTMEHLKSANPKFAQMPLVERGAVYNNTARNTPLGGSDFWESGVVNPDLILRDLIHIMHPEHLPSHELYYYKRLQ